MQQLVQGKDTFRKATFSKLIHSINLFKTVTFSIKVLLQRGIFSGQSHSGKGYFFSKTSLREKCLYSQLFWSVFPCIRTEYEDILHISSYSVRMRKNTDQNNCKYGHFYAVHITMLQYSFQKSIFYTTSFF